jgi:hypothetical protein
MQKVQSYLYPNRVILIADLAGFIVENTIVYAKTVKIYKGIDNVIQFDIQNADQKRLEVVEDPLITNIRVNVMDSAGNALPGSPYEVTPLEIKGIVEVTIPSTDLASINHQFLKYSVTATDSNDRTIPLYTDSRFSAVGKIEVVESATPVDRPARVFNTFAGEIDLNGYIMHRSSAIPAKFYEAIPTTQLTFELDFIDGFIGTVYIEGTKDMTISVNSFLHATKIQSHTFDIAFTGEYAFPVIDVAEFNYFRVTWKWPDSPNYTSYVTDNGPGKLGKINVHYGEVVC